jgi:hypothetical protein
MDLDLSKPPLTPTTEEETPKQRIDRELIELLNELRVALPGVQVLFAFLLTVPFTNRFAELTDAQRILYFATLLSTAFAIGCLMAPTAYHRIRFREGDKERMLQTANRLTLVGVGLLAAAMTGAILIVADLLFGLPVAVVGAASVAVVLVALWFGLPLWRRARDTA